MTGSSGWRGLTDVERPSENHFYLRQLEVDLSLASILSPEDFPLLSKTGA